MGTIRPNQPPQQVPQASAAQEAKQAQKAQAAPKEPQAASEAAQQIKDKLSGFLDKDTAEAISKAKMDPNSMDFKVPDKQHIRALKNALKSLNQIPNDTLQDLNLNKMKTKLEETLQQLNQGELSETTVEKLKAQLNNLTENVPNADQIRAHVKDALQDLQGILNKPSKPDTTEPKPPPHMRPNKIDPDSPHIMKYASVFAK